MSFVLIIMEDLNETKSFFFLRVVLIISLFRLAFP